MTKAKTYFVLALSMALLGLGEAISGFVLWFGFPGSGGGRGWGGGRELTYWAISKHTWIDIHDWVAVALIVMVTIHVILHWKWIVRMSKSLFRRASSKLVMNPVRA